MQLRLHPRNNKKQILNKLVFKTALVVIVLFIAIFLLDKIDMPSPSKHIKQQISNDKLITLK